MRIKIGISGKLMSVVVAAVLGFAVVTTFALSFLRASMLDDRIAKVRSLSETARDVAKGFHQRAQKGEFDQATAQAMTKAVLREMHYDGAEYFFAYDLAGTLVMLPPKPEREGQNLIDLKDPNGLPFIRKLVEAAKAGGGSVFYQFPRAGSDLPIDKVSYAVTFEPWGWLVGTGIYIDDVDAEFWTAARRFGLIVLAITVATGLVAVALARHIARPLLRLEGITTRLANDDLAVEVTETDRKDEIGSLAASIRVLRDVAHDAAKLRAAQDAEKHRREEEKRATAIAMANSFEGSVKQVADAIASSAQGMHGASSTLSGVAAETSGQASSVAAAAEEASANVQTVAAAAEELSASIREISRQVQVSSSTSAEAVAEAERTNALVLGLAETANRIGEIVRLINDIASQTNLLALNATVSRSIKQAQFSPWYEPISVAA